MRNTRNISHCSNQLFVRVVGVVRGLKPCVSFWPFFALLFFGSLFWAHSRDPFRRTEFSIKTAAIFWILLELGRE
jgi:hypothetical protein